VKHSLELHRGRHRRVGFGRRELAGTLLAGIVGGLAWSMLPAAEPAPAAAIRTSFGFCHSGGGDDCVVDGDTFRMDGDRIRIADIDTPETHPARCPEEARLGAAATQRLHALLNSGAITLHPIDRDTDRYGRKLRLVEVNGRSVGDTLVAEGLARPYLGRRMGWCG
jgi:endonuclease YncB( thermonuclease family)